MERAVKEERTLVNSFCSSSDGTREKYSGGSGNGGEGHSKLLRGR